MDGSMPDMTGRSRGTCRPSFSRDIEGPVSTASIRDVPGEYGHSSKDKHVSFSHDDGEDAELQQAIALSLQNEGNLSGSPNAPTSTGDELARALEHSIAQTDGSSTGPSGSGDGPSPCYADSTSLLRIDKDWPTGLKNVGNTCWFNVVIQSLFHLPFFRYIILKFSNPEHPPDSVEMLRNLKVTEELKRLFALMYSSKRSYLDPQQCINVLQDSFLNRSSDSQQDVSEFIHMLLDALEGAFQYKQELKNKAANMSEAESENLFGSHNGLSVLGNYLPDKKRSTNPMLDLFYGTTKTVGMQDGSVFEQENRFSMLPLCVEGRKNLHESLEHATAKGNVGKEKEMWFTKLPPVLTFLLSRFHFNQDLGKPEKLHDRLVFPSVLYMDRYMESSMEVTRAKREEMKQLSMHLHDLRLRLSRAITTYHNGRSYTLSDVLLCCANYASQKHSETDMDTSASQTNISKRRYGSESPTSGLSPHKRSKEDGEEMPTEEEAESDDHFVAPLEVGSSEACSEAQTVEAILRKWKENVDQEIVDLRNSIKETEMKLDKMFEEKSLRQMPYTLHAVLVHQGQALAGHYWAYIRDYRNQCWLRFNDVAVTEATFDQLATESVGGIHASRYYGNLASAYCLIYVDSKRSDLFADFDYRAAIAGDVDLTNLVNADNERLENELEQLDVEKAKQMSLESFPTLKDEDGGTAPGDNLLSDAKSPTTTDTKCDGGALDLAVLKNAIERVAGTYDGSGPEKALEQEPETEENREKGEKTPDDEGKVEGATRSNKKLHPTEDTKENTAPTTPPTEKRAKRTRFPSNDDIGDEAICCPVFQATIFAIMKTGGTYNLEGPNAALTQAISEEMDRLKALSMEQETLTNDPRLQNIVVYLYKNGATTKVVERCVLEQFTDSRLRYDRRSRDIMRCAVEKTDSLDLSDEHPTEVEEWRRKYHAFCVATCHMLQGLSLFHNRKFFDAAMHFVAVHRHNLDLVKDGQAGMGVDSKLVGRYCRTCVQRVNENAMRMLQSSVKEDALAGIELMRGQLIPCIAALLDQQKGGGTSNDLQLADSIRDDWCSLLEQNVVLSREQLSNVLTEFLDVNPKSKCFAANPMVELPLNLCQQYETVMSSLLHEPD